MCRVCLKRPAVPEERFGRCEACAKQGRIAYKFRLASTRAGAGLVVKAGELSPRALRDRWREKLAGYAATPSTRPHLGLHEAEVVVAKDRLETIRIAPDLASHAPDVVAALREAAQRSDAAW